MRPPTIFIEHDGKTLTAREWAQITGLPAWLIRARFRHGNSAERALRPDRVMQKNGPIEGCTITEPHSQRDCRQCKSAYQSRWAKKKRQTQQAEAWRKKLRELCGDYDSTNRRVA